MIKKIKHDYWKMYFWNFSALGMILSLIPHLEQPRRLIPLPPPKKAFFPIYHKKLSEKDPSIFYGEY